METIENSKEIGNIKDNRIIIDEGELVLENSKIIFRGIDNVLKVSGKVVLRNSLLDFRNNNSIIYLKDNPWHDYRLNIRVHEKCVFYCGTNNYFNNTLSVSVDEMRNIVIGNNCLFSFGIWLRTGDPHLVFDTITHKRINLSKDIIIGDHVWIGQNALLLKGTNIGSGSIVGANSVVAGKNILSNESWAGNPAKKVKEQVFFLHTANHSFDAEKQQEYMEYRGDEYIYNVDETSYRGMIFDASFVDLKVDDKLKFLESIRDSKNRFAQ